MGNAFYCLGVGGEPVKSFFGLLSFALSFGVVIPYMVAIVHGKARLARSTRVLFLLLITVTFIVQARSFTSWVLLLTIGELFTQIGLFSLSFKYGIGGWSRLDIICYILFFVSLALYLTVGNPALSLTLLILTDFAGFLPTLVKNWRDPTSDSWVFFIVGGSAAALASLLARNSNAYSEVLFPVYILIANLLAAMPIILHVRRTKRLPYQPNPPAP